MLGMGRKESGANEERVRSRWCENLCDAQFGSIEELLHGRCLENLVMVGLCRCQGASESVGPEGPFRLLPLDDFGCQLAKVSSAPESLLISLRT